MYPGIVSAQESFGRGGEIIGRSEPILWRLWLISTITIPVVTRGTTPDSSPRLLVPVARPVAAWITMRPPRGIGLLIFSDGGRKDAHGTIGTAPLFISVAQWFVEELDDVILHGTGRESAISPGARSPDRSHTVIAQS